MRKGQAALEFLMTYGWAILVVLAAIAALAYFGVLSPDRFIPPKCTITGGFSCTEYKVNKAGTVQFAVQNNLGVDATNVEITLATSDCTLQAPTTVAVAGVVNNGAEIPSSSLIYTCSAAIATKFKGDITVNYTRSGENVWHLATGSISGTAE